MRLAFALTVLLTACSSQEQTVLQPAPSQEPTQQPTGASAEPSSQPPAPVRPSPAAGTERLAFDLRLGKDQGKVVRATLDVPADLNVELREDGDVLLSTCRAAAIGSPEMREFWMRVRGVSLGVSPCKEGVSPKACLSKALEADQGESDVSWTGDTFAERFGSYSSKGGERNYGTATLYDPASHAVVSCKYDLTEESASYRGAYQSLCHSLGLAVAADKTASSRRGTMSAADREDLEGVPDKEKLKRTVEGFFVALGKRDLPAAKAFLLGPEACEAALKGAPPETRKKASLAGCKKQVKEDADALTLEVAEQYPKDFQLAAIRVARGDGLSKLKPSGENPMFEVLVTPKGQECVAELPVFVGRFGDDYRILVARKATPAEQDGSAPKGKQKKPATKP